MALLMTVESGL